VGNRSGGRLVWCILAAVSSAVWLPWWARAAGDLGITDALIEAVYREHGRRARNILMDWRALVARHRDADEMDKLRAVNRFFNRRIRFLSDQRHWGRRDYWATPVETMISRGGDCEDYAIAKYFTLRVLGVPDARLRITYVRARRLRQAHMVLAYYPQPGAEPLILDNLTRRIRPASRRRDLTPVYSFNGTHLWMAKARGAGRRVGSARRMNNWAGLLRRMGGGGAN